MVAVAAAVAAPAATAAEKKRGKGPLRLQVASAAAKIEPFALERWPNSFAGVWVKGSRAFVAFTDDSGPRLAKLRNHFPALGQLKQVIVDDSLRELQALADQASADRAQGRVTSAPYDLSVDIRRNTVVATIEELAQPRSTVHAADAVALQAQADLTVAYDDAAGRACDVNLSGSDLGGLTLVPGVYCFDSSAFLTGTVTLDAAGDPNAVFIFQIGSTLITASGSTVDLINGAQACNVYWQVGSSATLGTDTFVGNVLALTSITAQTGTTVDGSLLARDGAVTLDNNVITRAECATAGAAPVGLGTAGSFAVLGGSAVTNTGPSVISGDLGVSPGTAVMGFPPGTVIQTLQPPGTIQLFELLYGPKMLVERGAIATTRACRGCLLGGFHADSAQLACTMGFTARPQNVSAARNLVLSAGHCGDTPSDLYQPRYTGAPAYGQVMVEALSGPVDAEVHQVSNPFDAAGPLVCGPRGCAKPLTVDRVAQTSDLVEGQTVCKYGQRSRYSCGQVLSKDYRPGAYPFAADHMVQASVCSTAGDSGGPVFSLFKLKQGELKRVLAVLARSFKPKKKPSRGVMAQGLVSGGPAGKICPDPENYTIFSHIGYIESALPILVNTTGRRKGRSAG